MRYRSSGDYIVDAYKSHMGDPAAAERLNQFEEEESIGRLVTQVIMDETFYGPAGLPLTLICDAKNCEYPARQCGDIALCHVHIAEIDEDRRRAGY